MKELKNTNTAKRIFGLLHLPPLSLPRLTRQSLTALLAAFALLLVSCSNGINGTDADGSSADGKTYISISAKTAPSRSIAPGEDDYSTEKLTDLVLSGKTVGEGAESDTATDTEAVTLAQAESLAELSGQFIPIEEGNWLFTLSATLNGVTFYGETRAEIEKGKVNPISFTLTPATSYGGMSITVEFTGEADKVSVSLKKAGNEELLAGSELTPVQGSDGKKSVTFSRSATNEEEKLESGSYYLLFEFFGLEEIGRLNTVENIVRVKEGITTTAKLTLDLNEIYTISYETNGGEIASTDDILTNKYSRKSETISLPQMKKAGCIFKGWYENSDTDHANPLESIDSSRASNLTLVAYFEEIPSTFYVTARTLADGESDTGDGSQEKPFANIQNAIEKIKSYNAADVDYTITVSGMDDSTEKISGNKAGLLIADISAASILIQGDGTGVADGIQGTEYEYVPVVINTTVPVTFKDFVIKPNGYVNGTYNEEGYVVYIGSGSNVTLSQGFELDGSEDSFGTHTAFGAVYVSDGASLVMEENASVHDVKMSGKDSNTNDFGAGIFVAGNLEMGGTSSIYRTESTANKGGGIYIASTGKVTLKDSAIIGSTDSSKGNSCSYNGGGVYLAGGEFIMEGGTITGNVLGANSNNHGSGVFVESGTFKMSGSAVVAEDNDVYLASGTKVTIADALTGTSPVATLTPYDYSEGTALLEVAEDSDTTLVAEYEKFAVTKDAKGWYLSREGTITGFVFVLGSTATTPNMPNMYVSSHEVTQEEYETYCNYGGTLRPSSDYGFGDNYPAYCVSWYDAIVYCNLRSIAEGFTPCYSISSETNPSNWPDIVTESNKYCGPADNNSTWNALSYDTTANGYRLPTAEEWKYIASARNTDNYTFSGSNTSDDVAWTSSNSDMKSHEVMTKNANSLGIYDMSGNVEEWCWDLYDETNETERVEHGGSYQSSVQYCEVTYGLKTISTGRYASLGFRVVRNVE